MTKILLVEDDKSLREIYGVRLFAEGYDVVSAGDGEEALALAIKERPSLIVTDVMMPKISGFDMLDILRSTTETKDIKVIVMTALGSEDNKDRGERLGADRYLVKSQVGIEDVVHVVHELLGDQASAPSQAGPGPVPTPPPAAPAMPPSPAPAIQTGLPPAPRTSQPLSPPAPRPGMVSSPALPGPGAPANQQQVTTPNPMQQTPTQAAPAMPQATPVQPPTSNASSGVAEPPTRRAKIIQPISDPSKRVDIQALVDKELAKEGSAPVPTAAQERQVVANQLDSFKTTPPASELPPVNPAPAPATPAAPPQNPPETPNPAPSAPAAPQPPQVSAPTPQVPPTPPQAPTA